MNLTHSPFFVGLLMLLLLALGLNASWLRRSLKIYAGSGGNPKMHAAERAHGNTVEHALPLALLLVLLESMGAPKTAILVLGCLAVLARALRAAGFLLRSPVMGMSGVVTTYSVEGVMAVWLTMLGYTAMR